MSWAHPLLAWLLPLAVLAGAGLAAAWAAYARRRRRGVGAGLAPHTPTVSRARVALRATALWTGLLLVAVAIAGPRWGARSEVRRQTGCDVLLLIDCSRSMLASDLYPTRLEAARRKALDLLRLAPETRLALMPFAAVPVLRCPLTGDHEAVSTMLRDCSPDLFPADRGYQGTAIGLAVSEGLRALARGAERGQAILVLSDGADPDEASVGRAATEAREAAVPVFGLFVGDPDAKATLQVDGREVPMAAERATLDRLADASGGACVNATADDADVAALVARLTATVAQGEWESRARVVASERFLWPLLPAIALLAVGALLPTRRRTEAS